MSAASREAERRLLHASTAVIGYCLLVPAISDAARLALAVTAVTALTADIARRRWRVAQTIVYAIGSRWLRPAERGATAGSTSLAIGYAAAALLFPPPAAGRAVVVAALADPAASWIGRALGGDSGTKTIAGTIAAFTTAALALLALSPSAGSGAGIGIPIAAAVAALAERVPWRGVDNLLIAPLTAAALWMLD